MILLRIAEERNNYYRLTRAVEIVLNHETAMSELSIDTQKCLDYDFRCFFLHRPRIEIYHRIEQRCENMVFRNDRIPKSWTLDSRRTFERSEGIVGSWFGTQHELCNTSDWVSSIHDVSQGLLFYEFSVFCSNGSLLEASNE